MINCYVLDDEQHSVDILKKYISQTPFLQLAGSSTDAVKAVNELVNGDFDLLFLDIHMPEMSGIDILGILNKKTKVILTTAYTEYAVTSYEFEVIDYLLKPIGYARFLKSAQKVSAILDTASQAPPISKGYLFVRGDQKGKHIKIDYDSIDYIENVRNYVAFHCGDEKIMVLMSLKELEAQLPADQFIRIHNSYIIAINRISLIEGNQVVLKSSRQRPVHLPIGTTYKPGLLHLVYPKS